MPNPKKNESKQDFLKRCTQELIGKENRDPDQAFKLCNLNWDDHRNQRSVINMHLPVELAAGEPDQAREFMITAYTGKPLETWFGQVVFAIDGIKTKDKIPILREHQRDRVVGSGRSFNDKKNLYVKGEFSQVTTDSKEVQQLADEGFPWQASVAIWPRVVEMLESAKVKKTVNGREIAGPAEIWLESDVGEVSFVSLGRDDDTAAISLSVSEGKVPVEIINPINFEALKKAEQEDEIMEFTLEILKTEAPELLAQIQKEAADPAQAAGYAEGVNAERERVKEILDADADPKETRKAIDGGIEADAAFKQFYQAERAKRANGLKELEAEATPPAGSENQQDEESSKEKTPEETRREWAPVLGPAAK